MGLAVELKWENGVLANEEGPVDKKIIGENEHVEEEGKIIYFSFSFSFTFHFVLSFPTCPIYPLNTNHHAAHPIMSLPSCFYTNITAPFPSHNLPENGNCSVC
jgi:hypothetical protein